MTDQGSGLGPAVVVLAARHRTFDLWCHEHHVNPYKTIWVGQPEHAAYKIRRRAGMTVHLASDWNEVPGLPEVAALLHAREVALPPELEVFLRPQLSEDGWEPGRWYRILKQDGSLWMETSNRRGILMEWNSRPTNSGWTLQQTWVLHRERWGDLAEEET